MRTILEADVLSLKGATEASFALGKGVTSFANFTRVGVSTLVKYSSRGAPRDDGTHEHDQTLIPIDIAVEADRRAGSPVIVGEAARQLGYGLSPLAGEIEGKAVTEAAALKVMHEANDVSRAIVEAIADGRIDALDRKQIAHEAREAIRALQEVLAGLERGE